MTTITYKLLNDTASNTKHLGNYVFSRTADMASAYEVLSYDKYEPLLLKDLEKTFLITGYMTWDDVADRFFGTPAAPDFSKVLA